MLESPTYNPSQQIEHNILIAILYEKKMNQKIKTHQMTEMARSTAVFVLYMKDIIIIISMWAMYQDKKTSNRNKAQVNLNYDIVSYNMAVALIWQIKRISVLCMYFSLCQQGNILTVMQTMTGVCFVCVYCRDVKCESNALFCAICALFSRKSWDPSLLLTRQV